MKGRSSKLFFVITGLDFGGAEVQVLGLACELRARGWDIHVASMIRPGALAEAFQREGIPVHDLGMSRGVPSPLGLIRLARLIHEFSPDIVHSHMVHANLLARAVRGFFPHIPFINSGHSTREGRRWRYYAYRYSDRFCDRFHTVSKVAQDNYIRGRFVSSEKLFYLPNGIATDMKLLNAGDRQRLRSELGIDESFAYLSVARFEVPKNHATLIKAFASLPNRESARLLLVGKGRLEKELRQQSKQLGLEEGVIFLGSRSNVSELMGACNALVIGSHWEGLPMVLLEAGLAELPVVASSAGDIPQVIESGRSGLLVSTPEPEALADGMRHVRDLSPDSRKQMASALRCTVLERFDMRSIVDRWEEIYAELVPRSSS